MKDEITKILKSPEYGFNEIFCMKFAKLLDIPCAEYYFKKNGLIYNTKEIITKNFLERNQTFIPACSIILDKPNCLRENLIALTTPPLNQEYSLDHHEIEMSLFKMLVFDYLTSQLDRHDKNYGYIVTENGCQKTIEFAPLFDNEYSFGFSEKGFKRYANIKSIKNTRMCFNVYSGTNFYDIESNGTEHFENARDIIMYALKKPELEKYLKQTISNFKTETIIEEMKQLKPHCPKPLINLYDACVNQKMAELIKVYKHYKTNNINDINEYIQYIHHTL